MGIIVSKLESLFKGFEDHPVRVLMLGLDSAGKTTILYKLKLDKVVKTIPTIGFNVETLSPCKGLTFTVWDVGGQTKLRRLWKHYYKEAKGFIFVVDSADPSRFSEAKEELFGIIGNEEMEKVPILILANKQDMTGAEPINNIIEGLDLISIPQHQKWNVQPCSALKGEGIIEGLQPFSRMIKQHVKENN